METLRSRRRSRRRSSRRSFLTIDVRRSAVGASATRIAGGVHSNLAGPPKHGARPASASPAEPRWCSNLRSSSIDSRAAGHGQGQGHAPSLHLRLGRRNCSCLCATSNARCDLLGPLPLAPAALYVRLNVRSTGGFCLGSSIARSRELRAWEPKHGEVRACECHHWEPRSPRRRPRRPRAKAKAKARPTASGLHTRSGDLAVRFQLPKLAKHCIIAFSTRGTDGVRTLFAVPSEAHVTYLFEYVIGFFNDVGRGPASACTCRSNV